MSCHHQDPRGADVAQFEVVREPELLEGMDKLVAPRGAEVVPAPGAIRLLERVSL
ncbi:MAG: hypothetical protein ABI333_26855 [bacterium]